MGKLSPSLPGLASSITASPSRPPFPSLPGLSLPLYLFFHIPLSHMHSLVAQPCINIPIIALIQPPINPGHVVQKIRSGGG